MLAVPPPIPSPFVHYLPNGSQVALGRPRASVFDDPRTHNVFRLARYVDRAKLGPPPDKITHSNLFTPQMFANDRMGDCTIVGMANYCLLASAMATKTLAITEDDVIGRYARLTGYNPLTGANDDGAVETQILDDWRQDAFMGVNLLGYATVDVHDTDLLRHAINLFGAVYVGLSLPLQAKDQLGKLWEVTNDMKPGSWGGHCVILPDYDWSLPTHTFRAATWASLQPMTETWWKACGDEAYAPLTSIWADQEVPNGILFNLLEKDLQDVGRVH